MGNNIYHVRENKIPDNFHYVITRLETCTTVNDLKTLLIHFCRLMVKLYDLEKCLILLYGGYPFLPHMVVGFPEPGHTGDDPNQLKRIERELVEKETVINFPIIFKCERMGVILLVRKTNTPLKETEYNDIKKLATDCIRETTYRAVHVGELVSTSIKGKISDYMSHIAKGGKKSNNIIFDILRELFEPIQAYLLCQTGKGPYTYYSLTAENGSIKDEFQGSIGKENFNILVNQIIKSDPNLIEIDTAVEGLEGKIFLEYKGISGAVHDTVCLLLRVFLSLRLQTLVLFNRPPEEIPWDEPNGKKINKNRLKISGKRIHFFRTFLSHSLGEMSILLNTTEEHYMGIEDGKFPLNPIRLNVLRYLLDINDAELNTVYM